MVDGEALVMMMVMISTESPSRHGARTELLILVLGFSVAAEPGSVSQKIFGGSGGLGQRKQVFQRAALGTTRGDHARPRRGSALPAPRGGMAPVCAASVSSSEK